MNLEKNSQEMKTVVETFIIEETAELIYDGDKLAQWNKRVEELNLSEQAKIAKPEKSPIPFMHMKATTIKMFETLCPRKVKIREYGISPIPVEILDLVVLSKKEGYFDEIQIWYDDKNLDPVCVGLNFASEVDRISNHHWNAQRYLIGKWGDVKQSFSELKQTAAERLKKETIDAWNSQIRYYKRELEDIDSYVFRALGADTNLTF